MVTSVPSCLSTLCLSCSQKAAKGPWSVQLGMPSNLGLEFPDAPFPFKSETCRNATWQSFYPSSSCLFAVLKNYMYDPGMF